MSRHPARDAAALGGLVLLGSTVATALVVTVGVVVQLTGSNPSELAWAIPAFLFGGAIGFVLGLGAGLGAALGTALTARLAPWPRALLIGLAAGLGSSVPGFLALEPLMASGPFLPSVVAGTIAVLVALLTGRWLAARARAAARAASVQARIER